MKHLFTLLIVSYLTAHLFGAVIYVDASSPGPGSGTSWGTAYPTLQPALSAAHSGDQIWVAAGTYVPGTVNTAIFTLPLGVAIYGGFIGNEATRTSRNWQSNRTVLSGVLTAGGNCYQIMHPAGSNTIDGLVFTGASNGTLPPQVTGPDSEGGALISNQDSSNVTVSNCLFTNNVAQSGAAIYGFGTDATWTIDHCVFVNNTAVAAGIPHASSGVNGGAICGFAVAAISNCIFYGNSAQSGGDAGAVYVSWIVNTPFTNDVFINNSAQGSGGAVVIGYYANTSGASATFNGCTLVGNTAGSSGGALVVVNDNNGTAVTATFENGVLYGNTAPSGTSIVSATVSGATIALNIDTTDVRALDVTADAGTTVTYATSFYSDPHLASLSNLAGPDGIYFTADDGAMPLVGSPLIGVETSGQPALDINGTTRPSNGVAVTLGAYEFVPAANGASGSGSGTAGSGVAGSGSAGGSGTGTATSSSSSGGGCGLGSGMGLLLVGALMFRRKS